MQVCKIYLQTACLQYIYQLYISLVCDVFARHFHFILSHQRYFFCAIFSSRPWRQPSNRRIVVGISTGCLLGPKYNPTVPGPITARMKGHFYRSERRHFHCRHSLQKWSCLVLNYLSIFYQLQTENVSCWKLSPIAFPALNFQSQVAHT